MKVVHLYSTRVHYEDTDFSGFVYHANYLKFCERARSDWLRVVGVDQNAMFARGEAFVVRKMVCEFLRPARFEDELGVETEVKETSGARFVLLQCVKRSDETLFSAEVTVAIIGPGGRPLRVPVDLIEKIGS